MEDNETVPIKVDETENINNNNSDEKSADILPNQTIYVNNLYEKISKKKLVEQLYSLFSKYGSILEIVASKDFKKRGQAFIVFQDLTSATNALREMDGFKFLDKPIRVQYSRNKSDAVAKLDGTYMDKKRQRENDREESRAKNKKAANGSSTVKKSTTSSNSSTSGGVSIPANLQPRDDPPNKTLFIENLPEKCEPMMLQMLFGQFQGFQAVHMIESKKGIAFVDFDDEVKAGLAMSHLQHFKVTPEKPMVVSYSAK